MTAFQAVLSKPITIDKHSVTDIKNLINNTWYILNNFLNNTFLIIHVNYIGVFSSNSCINIFGNKINCDALDPYVDYTILIH